MTCEESEPFCTGSIYRFPAGVLDNAQYGANYGFLLTQPAPAWYHMLIDDPGNINIYMYSTPLEDIDFICWGPFTDPLSPCVTGLTSDKIVSCSYSPLAYETCYIPNGQTGEYYILLITNFSRNPCDITFSQTGGNGSTDCTILPPPVTNNGPLCVGGTLNLYEEDVTNASYWWSGPAGFLSAEQNPVITNVTTANAGAYSCIITVGGQSSDPAITNVVIYTPPTAALLSTDTTVCYENPAYAIMQFTGWGPYKVFYDDGLNNLVATNLNGPSDTIFLYPSGPTTYTFTKVEDLHCERSLLFMDLVADTYPETSGTLSGSATICAGEPADLTFNLTGTPPWSITYTANGGSPQVVAANASPYILTVYPASTTTYAFMSLEDINCPGETSGQAVVTVNPSPTTNAGTDHSIPYGTSTVLNGNVTGGSGTYSYLWSSDPPGFSSTLPDPTVSPSVSTTYHVMVNDGYNVLSGNAAVSVHQLPVPEAGDNIIILHGTNAVLQGSASSGSGSYAYHWEPADKLVDANVAQPQTLNLFSSTLFTLYVTDVTFGCVAEAPDQVTVIISGDALAINPSVSDEEICLGESAQLFALAGGGSGSYTYSWSSSDGFTSTQQNPMITPLTSGSFIYNCAVSDGFNTAQGSVAINVRPIPSIDFGFGDTTICVYDSVILDAGNPGSSYVWSNGSTERTILVATTGIGFDIQTYSVTVTNQSGCTADLSTLIMFDFSACTGVEGMETDWLCRIYPNPGNGTLHLVFQPGVSKATVTARNILGQNIWGSCQYDASGFDGEVVIHLGEIPDGLYFININSEDYSYTTKYILRR